MLWYGEGEGDDFGPPYGVLPPKSETWYDFRVHPEDATKVVACLGYAPDLSYPYYYARKEEFTDENGVFDVDKADRVMVEGDANEQLVDENCVSGVDKAD